jgi:hypothetical protein
MAALVIIILFYCIIQTDEHGVKNKKNM